MSLFDTALGPAALDLCALRGIDPSGLEYPNVWDQFNQKWLTNEEACKLEILKAAQLKTVLQKHGL